MNKPILIIITALVVTAFGWANNEVVRDDQVGRYSLVNVEDTSDRLTISVFDTSTGTIIDSVHREADSGGYRVDVIRYRQGLSPEVLIDDKWISTNEASIKSTSEDM